MTAAQASSTEHASYRKLAGLVIFTIACFAYALVSQGANHIMMPSVPLYQPPFGGVGNVLMATLIGASLGLLLGWFESGAVSVLWASLLGAFFISAATLLTGQDPSVPLANRATAVAMIFLPVAGALFPGLLIFRWLAGREVMAYREVLKGRPSPPMQRYAWPMAALLVCAALGLTSLYPDIGRAVTPQMHQLIQQGMQAKSEEELPSPLRPPDVQRFSSRAQGRYSLQWDRDEQNQFAIPRPAGNISQQSTVIARFENGYILACMFPGKNSQPTCRDLQ